VIILVQEPRQSEDLNELFANFGMSDEEWEEEYAGVVLDNGSYMMKAGFAGGDAPRAVFPNLCGEPSAHFLEYCNQIKSVMQMKEKYVGDEVVSKRGILKYSRPVQNGQIADWDQMEAVWKHTFWNELCADPSDHPMILTTSPLTSDENKQKTAQIMFENFCVPKLSLKLSEECSLFISGRSTGIVVSSGHEITYAVPIVDGIACKDAIHMTEFGGRHVLDHLLILMSKRGYEFSTTAEKEICRDMKHKLCSIMENAGSWNLFGILQERNCQYPELVFDTLSTLWGEERNLISQVVSQYLNYQPIPQRSQSYELPSGNLITMDEEQHLGPELLFQPSLAQNYANEKILVGCRSIQQITQDAITKAGPKKELYNNIVLAGGNTMFPNIGDRLESEINTHAPDEFSNDTRVVCPPERKYSAWIGASVLSQMPFLQDFWITKHEYDENGPSVVQRFEL